MFWELEKMEQKLQKNNTTKKDFKKRFEKTQKSYKRTNVKRKDRACQIIKRNI